MKQILQDLQGGQTFVEDVPAPICRAGHVCIGTSVSLVSAGTERILVDFARGSLIAKARQQPERVAQVLDKIRTDGLQPTVDAIRSKLDQPLALGYCNVGRILEMGSGVEEFRIGERVVSNGKHAEVVVVPRTLCAGIPDDVDDESAAFTVLGAIALQSVRLAAPTLGEAFVVTGLGLIGLLAVQILRANGCRVLGVDIDPERLELARRFGAEVVDLSAGEDPLTRVTSFSRGRGVDGVLVAASTRSSEPVSQAARMCRQRGRVVLVGVTGLELNRSDFYEKEITFQVSCSYGPGRYDPEYEERGHDYPLGFVRWTEQRNFEAVLDMMASSKLDVRPLISHRFSIEEASKAYDVLASAEKSLGILISYPTQTALVQLARRLPLARPMPGQATSGVVGFVGAGNYGGRILVKAFKDAGAVLHTIVSANGVSAAHYGRKFSFQHAASEAQAVLDEAEIDTVCIATRHDTHARYVQEALGAGKNVFVEKPLCLTLDELHKIESALSNTAGKGPLLMVGFNRRFAPMVVRAKSLISTVAEPKSFVLTINAGSVPVDHWTQDPKSGGGRILGEGCHFIDLLRFLAGAPIEEFDVVSTRKQGGPPRADTAILSLRFADGSIGVVNYLSDGHRGVSKERLEIYCAGRILLLDNYRRLTVYGWPGVSGMRSWRQDKGQAACARRFIEAVRYGGPAPIPRDEIFEVGRIAIEAASRT
jgi:predicted dehydrogenase/threonine dehydrogenase-like Zn-dependent dehydrogenase